MNDKQKRKKIRDYFTKKSSGLGWPSFLVFGGAFAFMVGASNYSDEFQCAGAGMVLIGLLMGAVALGKRASIPEYTQIDKWFEEDINNIREHALRKLDLSKEQLAGNEILLIIGPIIWADDYNISDDDILFKLGKDNILRYTIIDVLYVITAEHLLAAYECVFNFLKNEKPGEETFEFHYQDIVAVTTQEKPVSRKLPQTFNLLRHENKDKKKVYKEKHFQITVPGESISIPIDVIADNTLGGVKGNVYYKDKVDQTVQRLRVLIREKKQALASQPIPTSPPAYTPPPPSMPSVPETPEPGFQAPPPENDNATQPGTSAAQTPDGGVHFCSNCGRQVQPEERFCSNCGNQLRS